VEQDSVEDVSDRPARRQVLAVELEAQVGQAQMASEHGKEGRARVAARHRRRWRANGVWAAAMMRLAAVVRLLHGREPVPSMVMVDAQTVKGGRYGPTFHEAGGPGGRTIGTKRTLLVEILGLPIAARADSARPHDVIAARELLRDRLSDLPRVHAIVGDRAYRGLVKLAESKHVTLDIKAPPSGRTGFTPRWPLYNVEHAIAQLGRWRRLSRCYEGTTASARAWLEVASVGYLAWRASI